MSTHRYDGNEITALIPAGDGWRVEVTSPSSGNREVCLIVAWAAQCLPDADGKPNHGVHPVFILDGRTWTLGDLDQIIRADGRILPPGERP